MLNILKNKNIIIFVFLLLTIISVFIAHNVFNKKEVEKVFEENKVNKNQFAMYVENESGEFVEYIDNELFPDSSMYTFNEEKSYCVDNKDNIVDNVISYDSGKVTVTSNKTIYCTLYFNGDSIPPIISVNIIDNYYTSARLSILSNESGTYCINTSNIIGDISNCTLQGNVAENVTIITSNFTTSNQYYVHIKDKYGNETISEALDIKVLYQKVEYIETTGTQYIDSGVKATDSSIDFTLQLTNDSVINQGIIGARVSSSTYLTRFNLFYNNHTSAAYTLKLDWEGVTQSVNTEIMLLNEDINIKLNEDRSVIVNGNEYSSTAGDAALDLNMYIGNFNNNGTPYQTGAYAKWKTVKMYTSGVLVRDFVPVYRVSDNVVGMFDEVNKVFYTNIGTGAFGKGDNINEDAPTNNSVVINDGVTKTNNTSVTLTLSSNGATEMCVSNTNTCDNWEIYGTSKDWTLTEGEGTKTVYVWYRDDAGNTTNYVTDKIILNILNYVCDSGTTLGTCLQSAKTAGFNSTMKGGLYRYQGASGTVDNYICFGTSDKDTCLANTDAHMYRIIGIASDGRIKVMKNYALNTAYYWHNSYSSSTTWPNSDLYKGLNGISGGKYSNLFIGNTSYMPDGWEDKIETTTWKHGYNTNVNVTADALYNTENAWTNTTNAKIGLIYAHDYAYAYQSGGLNCSGSGSYSTCVKSWMHISVSDSGAPDFAEWTMSRYGYDSALSAYTAWAVFSNGFVSHPILNDVISVRPVFYLKSTVQFEGGTGTSNDPFIIS